MTRYPHAVIPTRTFCAHCAGLTTSFGSVSLPDAQCALGGLEMTTDETLEGLRSYYHQEQLAGPIAELIEATAVVTDLVAAMRDDLGTLDLAFDRQERAVEALMSAYQQAMADFIVDSSQCLGGGSARIPAIRRLISR
jgi:hypothetical protein